jgi:hypothetical protein
VSGGTVSTALTSGTPFGTGSITLGSGALVLSDGSESYFSIFLDFSVLGGDPDSGAFPFWSSTHQWTIWIFKTTDWNGLWSIANGTYLSGDFTYSWADNDPLALYLNWTPTPARRTPAERLTVQARARPTIKRPDTASG